MPSTGEGVRALASYLTGAEAKQMADQVEASLPMSTVRSSLAPSRAPHITSLIERSGLANDRPTLVSVLRAVEGARASSLVVSPVWTAPDNLVGAGRLTSTLHQYIDNARESVICATYNFQRSSALWEALKAAAGRPGLDVQVYMDRDAADENPAGWKPTTREVAATLAPAQVYRTVAWQGTTVRTHAKFIAVDHQYLIVMSANFSKSAEHHNVELGLVVHDRAACEGVLATFGGFHDLFERVPTQ